MNEATKRRIRTTRFTLSIYWLAMFIGSHMPMAPIRTESHYDKLIHFAAFAGLAFFMAFYRGLLGRMTRNAYTTIFVIAAIYGIFDELTQMLIAGRTADPFDWLADITGAAAGLIVYWLYDREASPVDGV
jgi:VanZ family protein